jgi:hypothetical protein
MGQVFLMLLVMTDFEMAMSSAFKHTFPNIDTKTASSIWNKLFFSRLKKLGLVRRYGDVDVRRAYRHLISLTFLPQHLSDEEWP